MLRLMTTVGDGAPPDSNDRFWTVGVRKAMQVGHTLHMLHVLPGVRSNLTDASAQVACLESFLVHVRLMTEFLLVCPPGPRDFTAADYGWKAAFEGDEKTSLRSVWEVVSQQVVHMSHERVPPSLNDIKSFDVSEDGLRDLADKVFLIYDRFVEAVTEAGHEQAALLVRQTDYAQNPLDEWRVVFLGPAARASQLAAYLKARGVRLAYKPPTQYRGGSAAVVEPVPVDMVVVGRRGDVDAAVAEFLKRCPGAEVTVQAGAVAEEG
jgi:hypothetical protein